MLDQSSEELRCYWFWQSSEQWRLILPLEKQDEGLEMLMLGQGPNFDRIDGRHKGVQPRYV